MLTRPSIKRHFHVQIVAGDGVYLLSEREQLKLEGSLYERIVPLLDGKRTVDDILALPEMQLEAAEVMFALMQLEERRCLAEGNDQPPHAAAYWDAQSVDPSRAADLVQRTTLEIHTVGHISTDAAAACLQRHGLQLGETGSLVVVITDDYLDERIAELNRRALDDKRPWVLVKPVGIVTWIGPIFVPMETGCWECLAHRLRRNQPVLEHVRRRANGNEPPKVARGALPTTIETTLGLLATHLVRWIGSGSLGGLSKALLTFDSSSGALDRHTAPHRPQCPACGDAALYARQVQSPIRLASQATRFADDGGYRVTHPSATVQRFERFVSGLTGVVKHVQRARVAENPPVHVYSGSHAGALHSDAWGTGGIDTGHLNAGGKGKTDMQARASVLGEALERASGTYHGDEPCTQASYNQLGDDAIHPNACLLFSEAQYRSAVDRSKGVPYSAVPTQFDPAAIIDWTPVWSLTQQRHRYLPTSYLYYAYPASAHPVFCVSDSNGNACGNTREEAILQGFLELVERDAVAIWWYNRLRRPGVGLDAVNDPYVHDLREFYRSIGRELWVLNITSDLGVPTFAGVSRRIDGPEEILTGFGSHFDPSIAVGRALTEVNQLLSFADEVRRGERQVPDQVTRWFSDASCLDEPYLVPAHEPEMVLKSGRTMEHDLKDDVGRCQRIAEDAGMEMLILDQTRPDLHIPVVKVIVPGLRHFWARFAPGRLYDVPVSMGWIPRPTAETELNPVPMFL